MIKEHKNLGLFFAHCDNCKTSLGPYVEEEIVGVISDDNWLFHPSLKCVCNSCSKKFTQKEFMNNFV